MSMNTAPVAGTVADHADEQDPQVRSRAALLALVCSVQFIVLVSATVVMVSLPAISQDLRLVAEDLQWVVTAFALPFGGLLLLGGRCADVLGRRRLLLAGLVVFASGSLACATAPSGEVLVAARAVQGTGAAMASPAALSLLTSVFSGARERSLALGAWAAVGAAGATLGNVIGGLLTTFAGWRAVFLVNVPVCAGVAVAALFLVPAMKPQRRSPLGLVPALTVTVGIGLLIYGLAEARAAGLSDPTTLGALGGSLVLLLLFALAQRVMDDPLLPPSLFRQRSSLGFLFVVLAAGSNIGTYYLVSMFMQDVLGWTALQAGLAFTPWSLLIAVTAQVTSRALGRAGPRLVLTGAFLSMAAGTAWMSLALSGSSGFVEALLGPFLLLGVGGGAAGVSATVTAMSGVSRATQGVAAGVLNSGQQVGGALSIAVLVLVAAARTDVLWAAGSAQEVADLAGLRAGLSTATGIALVGGLLALLLLPRRVRVPRQARTGVALTRPLA